MSVARPQDEKFMRMALALARRGLGSTSPNPMVGTVIVRDGRVLSRGWHRAAGLPHAEVEALSRLAGQSLRDATLYVNLEPCCHQGRTGPCTDAILASGIPEVVIGAIDPNPRVNGQGIARLKDRGVRVRTGVLEESCRRFNEAFFRFVTTGRPHVTLKVAVSLDGRIAGGQEGAPRWITGEASRAWVHRQRNGVDAILVGAGTVASDDPLLTTRLPRRGDGSTSARSGRTGRRVVLDPSLRTPPTARVIAPVAGSPPTTLFAAEDAPPERERAIVSAGGEVIRVPRAADAASGSKGLDLGTVLEYLARGGVVSLLVEGGAKIFAAFLRARVVDRVAVFVAGRVLGTGIPWIDALPSGFRIQGLATRRFGDDVLFEGRPEWSA